LWNSQKRQKIGFESRRLQASFERTFNSIRPINIKSLYLYRVWRVPAASKLLLYAHSILLGPSI